MKNIYIVKYCGGDYDGYYNKSIFVTKDKNKAIKYCEKFNRILKNYKDYYKKFEDNKRGFRCLKDKYVNKYFNQWYRLKDIEKCYYDKIEIR